MDWVHLHLALNHIPVLGTPFLVGMLVWSWARKQTTTLRFCLWLCVVLAIASIAIKFTGDFAAEGIGKSWPGLDAGMISRHEESADQATTGVFFMGIAAAGTLWLSRGGKASPAWALLALVLIALATFLLMARTANLGGQIRHPEIRPGSGTALLSERAA